MEYFDFQTVADEAGVSTAELGRLVAHIEREYPDDAMMRELHLLRACRAIRDGRVTLEEALTGGDKIQT